ncbi:hypothetical protein GPECTOR_1g733 [Gonium pectorale]|uniref:Uncharacterized protein n=1 Tax=Gonium pectorale TaxID=33097 RepID=A0A150H424_GONPE|nr:hypothetical protein GPECTOR_1g733 [Gonium pectorale]|eukprot:KXZ56814.1 hypothetical protein GPECTOR_1g733 [Gonium pectorale]
MILQRPGTGLQESHATPVFDIAFNTLGPEHRNLFASIGKDQVTIYDDEHMGDYLGVVVQYVNSPTEHHKGGDVTCSAWVQMEGVSRHELGDACLAVSGPEGVIQVISVAEARVVAMMRGHGCEVVELRGCPGVPGLLLSVGADGGVALWDLAAEGALIARAAGDAQTGDLHPEGRVLFTGHKGGRICRWDLDLGWEPERSPQHRDAAAAAASSNTPAASAANADASGAAGPSGRRRLVLRGGMPSPCLLALPSGPSGPALGDHVDCVRCLPGPGERLAAKSADGRMAVWTLGPAAAAAAATTAGAGGGAVGGASEGQGEEGGGCAAAAAASGPAGAPAQTLSLRVPGIHPAAGGRCRLSVARDGAFVCVGNPAGDVFVYDTLSGARAAHYSAGRASGSSRSSGACATALSEDGRHLLVARGHGYILRYEYLRRPALGTAEAGDEEASEALEAEPASELLDTEAVPTSREASPELGGAEEGVARAGAAAGSGGSTHPQAGGGSGAGAGLVGAKRRRPSEEGAGATEDEGGAVGPAGVAPWSAA